MEGGGTSVAPLVAPMSRTKDHDTLFCPQNVTLLVLFLSLITGLSHRVI